MTQSTYPRARRMVLLYRLRLAGVLGNLTLREIGEILGISRATLLNDFRDLDRAEEEFRALMTLEPWKEYETFEEDEIDDEIEMLKRLTRDGLVWLRHWVVPQDVHD
jgi:hypothetical protein